MSKRNTRKPAAAQQQSSGYAPDTLAWFSRVGIILDKNGLPQQTPATPALLEVERIREAMTRRIPAAPRYLIPDAAGKGVTRNAWMEPLADRHLRQYGRKSPIAVKSRYACVSQVSSGCVLILGSGRANVGPQAGVQAVHKDHVRDRPIPEGFRKYIEQAEDLLRCPYRGDGMAAPVLSTPDLVRGIYGDLFDLNRGVLEPIWEGQRIVGGRPADGGLIIPAWEMVQHWTGKHGTIMKNGVDLRQLPARDRLAEVSQDIREKSDSEVDLTVAEWVIYRDGIVEGSFQRGQLIVSPMMTSTDIEYAGHPPSYLQLGMEFAAMSWVIHDYHGRKFTDAAWTSQIIAVIGEAYDDEAFQGFINGLRQGKGYQRAGLPHVMHLPEGSDLKTVDTRPPVPEAQFISLTAQIENAFCAIIRRHPEIVNGATFSASGPRLTGPSEEMRIRVAREEGQVADVTHIALTYLTPFVQMAVHPDLQVIPVFPAADRGVILDLVSKEIASLRTRNEGCVSQGIEPMGFFLTRAELKDASDEDRKKFYENPWNYPVDSGFLNTMKFTMALNQGQDQQDAKAETPPPLTLEHAPNG